MGMGILATLGPLIGGLGALGGGITNAVTSAKGSNMRADAMRQAQAAFEEYRPEHAQQRAQTLQGLSTLFGPASQMMSQLHGTQPMDFSAAMANPMPSPEEAETERTKEALARIQRVAETYGGGAEKNPFETTGWDKHHPQPAQVGTAPPVEPGSGGWSKLGPRF